MAKAGHKACAWCGGTDHLRITSKRCPRHAEWKEFSREEANKISRKIYGAARSQQTERYAARKGRACNWCLGLPTFCLFVNTCVWRVVCARVCVPIYVHLDRMLSVRVRSPLTLTLTLTLTLILTLTLTLTLTVTLTLSHTHN